MVPSLHELPAGCKFQDRCPAVQDECRRVEPELRRLGDNQVRCHFPVEHTAAEVAS
jgi:dipeptide transport system ATP-binding protein